MILCVPVVVLWLCAAGAADAVACPAESGHAPGRSLLQISAPRAADHALRSAEAGEADEGLVSGVGLLYQRVSHGIAEKIRPLSSRVRLFALSQIDVARTHSMLQTAIVIARWLLVSALFIFVVACCFLLFGCCSLQYQKPEDDHLIESDPQLEPVPPGENDLRDSTDGEAAAPTFVPKHSMGVGPTSIIAALTRRADRIFILPVMGSTATHCSTICDVCDQSGAVILKAVASTPQYNQWYNKWYGKLHEEGPLNVVRATPWARLAGVTTRQQPMVALHGPAATSALPMEMGPMLASCRASEEIDETSGSRKLFLYDAKDDAFAFIQAGVQASARSYTLTQPGGTGQQLTFEGNLLSSLIVMCGKKKVAFTESMGNTTDPRMYKLHVNATDWSTVVMIVIGAMAIDVEEAVRSLSERPHG